MQEEGKKVPPVGNGKKPEELRWSVFLAPSGAGVVLQGSSNTVTVGPEVFENIFMLPLKRENGTFTLVFLHLMALPETPCPPWAIN